MHDLPATLHPVPVHPVSPRPARRRLPGLRALPRAALLGAAASLLSTSAFAQGTWRVSTDAAGVEGNDASDSPSISEDGRFVAFASVADNLVPGDTNGVQDAFVRDRRTGEIWRVSVDSSGAQANGSSLPTSITPDGRHVAFQSEATNLVAADSNAASDCFVHDRQTGSTVRVSVDSAGTQGGGTSYDGSISDDGSLVAFSSAAADLVPGDLNGEIDVFVRDLLAGTTTRVSVDSFGNEGDRFSQSPSLSGDGLIVAFWSISTNLIPSDGNGKADVFVHELLTGATTRVSVHSSGAEGDGGSFAPSISRDGGSVAFHSFATNLVPEDINGEGDVFVHDRGTGTTTFVSIDSAGNESNGKSLSASISADGMRVAFSSAASNLVPGDGNGVDDVFLHDRTNGRTTRVSIDGSGAEGNAASSGGRISGDGRSTALHSDASNLVPGDGNAATDVFVHGPPLTLEASQKSASEGDSLALGTWGGKPGGLALLVVVDVSGTPFFTILARGNFDPDGEWSLAGTVPAGVAGFDVSFQSFGFVPTGKVGLTNRETVSFE